MLALLAACSSDDSTKPPDGGSSEDTDCTADAWYADADGDGFGGSEPTHACEQPSGYVDNSEDCDDTRADVHPDATETCNDTDDDCDGGVDEELSTIDAAPDSDGDGFGDAEAASAVCALPDGWVEDARDCDDADAAIHPDATEICNGFDDDCDGLVDDDDDTVAGVTTWCSDADADGYGDPEDCTSACSEPTGSVGNADDCDDADAGIHPDAEEECWDLIDQDCDGYEDDYGEDCDDGGFGTEDLPGCDASIVPVDASLCAAEVAAVRTTGDTYATVQAAIDAAGAGETVTVCSGTWTENLNIPVSLALVGFGSASSVLDGGGAQVMTATGVTLSLVDLGVEGGVASDGGGLYGYSVELCVARCAFTDNEATYCGAAISLGGVGSLTIDASSFSGGFAEYCAGAIEVGDDHTVLIGNSAFSDNTTGYEAGAMSVGAGSPTTIWDSEFSDNYAEYEGGAISFGGSTTGAGMTLIGVSFTANEAGYEGGALSLGSWDATETTCYECTFAENESESGGAVDLGSWNDAVFTAYLSTFSANVATSAGGAIALGSWGDQTVNLEACTLDSNTAESGGAIGQASRGIETVLVVGSSITSNVAESGGGAGLDTDGTLTSHDTDWGAGATENAPDDVSGGYTYGSGASFVCVGSVCS